MSVSGGDSVTTYLADWFSLMPQMAHLSVERFHFLLRTILLRSDVSGIWGKMVSATSLSFNAEVKSRSGFVTCQEFIFATFAGSTIIFQFGLSRLAFGVCFFCSVFCLWCGFFVAGVRDIQNLLLLYPAKFFPRRAFRG